MRTNEGTVDDEQASANTGATGQSPSNALNETAAAVAVFDAGDWKSRIIAGRATGAAVQPPVWLDASYETLRTQVMDPAYPCFFGTMA